MAFDEVLAERIREVMKYRPDVQEKKMFGGLCFMVSGHMCCGIVKDTLMGRVGKDAYEACLQKPYVSEMDFTGKALKGMVYIAPEGIGEDSQLNEWISRCLCFVDTLPPK